MRMRIQTSHTMDSLLSGLREISCHLAHRVREEGKALVTFRDGAAANLGATASPWNRDENLGSLIYDYSR